MRKWLMALYWVVGDRNSECKVMIQHHLSWPIFVQDLEGHRIYLTWERWEHALNHPGMHEELLDYVLETLRKGKRKQDSYDTTKFKYTYNFPNLSMFYTHIVVVVKFSWQDIPNKTNNFVLTAYLIEKW